MSKVKDSDILLVFKYLHDQNRPYSITDIFLNLHKEIGKTLLQKVLDSLVQKTYGKQKIYLINQDSMPCLSNEEMHRLDQTIEKLSSEVKENETNLKILEEELKQLSAALTIEQIQEQINSNTMEIENIESLLSKMPQNTIQVCPREKHKLEKECEKYKKELKKRKHLATDIIDTILENYPKKKKDFFEELSLNCCENDK